MVGDLFRLFDLPGHVGGESGIHFAERFQLGSRALEQPGSGQGSQVFDLYPNPVLDESEFRKIGGELSKLSAVSSIDGRYRSEGAKVHEYRD